MSEVIEYKGYRIVSDGTFGYKQIKPYGKTGSVPKPLRGNFTASAEAIKCIDNFEDRLSIPKKADKDVETK